MEKTIELLKEFKKRDWLANIGKPITDTDFKKSFNEINKLKKENRILKTLLIVSVAMYLSLFIFGLFLFY
jgi:hypothetical protein